MGYSKRLTQNNKRLSIPVSDEIRRQVSILRNYYKLDTNVEVLRRLIEDKYNEIV